ncbi:1-aminocyclopropane-1-carboxylate deaminase [Leptospira yasudae]|uniref:1-aminocyclopropane-1-carboxylate deaminase n=1 Tax=Leptospira yasudae TaxID=2202201 RepID=A0A6N4QF25_9LEPT|nr:1-aminocyclopropane-1-carboxylate deaminase [Leptospira yasudae]TGL76324.1 1-aminocyclopropane-1-carboxylate deaminase [Leptospira yasudae]TGL82422.1 1-aminocyclopropane-1-carboxylate deaminase [Leptospira yasudae]TGL84354.1 1-aminocyclopropane-1-carboxylate deaminase [Leptospira yasudae]
MNDPKQSLPNEFVDHLLLQASLPIRIQKISFNGNPTASVSVLRDDRLAFGIGTKFRKFLGIHSALRLKSIRSVFLQGELHSNALGAFAFLFRRFGYEVRSIAYARDPKRASANSILTTRHSHSLELFSSRTDWMQRILRLPEKTSAVTLDSFGFANSALDKSVFCKIDPIQEEGSPNPERSESVLIPEYGLCRAALEGLDSLWEKIPISEYDRIVVDIGSGSAYLSALRFFEDRIPFYGVAIGLPKSKLLFWLEEKKKLLGLEWLRIADGRILEPVGNGGFGAHYIQNLEYSKSFYQRTGIPVEPIYSARTLAVTEMRIRSGEWSGRTLYIHQGGLLNFLDPLTETF